MHWGLNKDKRRRQALVLVLSTSWSPHVPRGHKVYRVGTALEQLTE